MQRMISLVPVIVGSAMAIVFAQSTAPSELTAESHHCLILENEMVRVFTVKIPAAQEVYVRHQHNFLTVALQGSRMVMWTEGTSPQLIFPINAGDTRFFLGGVAIGTRNDGNSEYSDITVEFRDPRVTNFGFQHSGADSQKWSFGSSALAPPADPQTGFVHALPLQQAVVRDARLLPGELLPALDQPTKELLIAVTDLNLMTANGESFKKAAGEIVWLEGRGSALINNGRAPARLVEVELK